MFVDFGNVWYHAQTQLEWLLLDRKLHQRTYSVWTYIFQYFHDDTFVADAYDSRAYLEYVLCFYE